MKKGTIIYLNGVTSSGKSSVAKALRQDMDFYYLSDDVFEDHIVHMQYDAPDYWERLAQAVFLMYRTAALFSNHGKTVVIDSMLLEAPAFAPHYQTVLDIFRDHPLFMVDVHCPLEICRQRNVLRGDRHENQSQEQAEQMAQNVQYHLHLDTSTLSPAQCAREIIRGLNEKPLA